MSKIVKEHINEKFSEDSDPVYDMGIGISQKIETSITKLNNYLVGRKVFRLTYNIDNFSIKNGKKIIFKSYFIYSDTVKLETLKEITKLFEDFNLLEYLDLPGKIKANFFIRNMFLHPCFFVFCIKPEYQKIFNRFSGIYELHELYK